MINVVGYRVLVKPDPMDEVMKTDWGFEFVVGENNKKLEKSVQIKGTLVSVGEQAWQAFGVNFSGTPWAQVGDRVLFAQHAGRFIIDPETEEEYLILNDEDIIAVITGEK